MRLISLIVVAGLVVPTIANAKSKRDRDRDGDSNADQGWEDVGEFKATEGPTQLKVPSTYVGKGYSLRVDSDLIALDKETLAVKSSERRERIDLIDGNGRILRSDRTYLDQSVFKHLDGLREYHIGLFVGGASGNGKAFRKLLQDSHVQETSGDFLWQPTSFGLLLTLASQTNELNHDFGVKSVYKSNQTRLSATYEFAPFRGEGNARRIHFLAYAGGIIGHSTIALEDDEVTLEDSSNSTGGIIGIDTMYPLNDFWLSMRTYLSYQKIDFEDFDFETQSVQRGLLFGGFYAF